MTEDKIKKLAERREKRNERRKDRFSFEHSIMS